MPRAFGQVATSATTEVPVESTTYTEQTSGAQRSLVSSSANDAAAGTGARKVRVYYFLCDAGGSPTRRMKTEDVTLNGTAAVAMVETALCFVEKMEVTAAGSGGVAAGTISMKAASDGTGATVGSIATGDVRTRWAHHYVPSGGRCYVQDLTCAGGDAAAAVVQVKALPYPAGVEQALTDKLGTTLTLPRDLQGVSLAVAGPARVRATVAPANGNAQTTHAGFGYKDDLAVV